MPYTASSVFLKSLAAAGITHAFVNWGSDHPALLEDLQRQRTESEHRGQTLPRIVTCPNEMVALSAAQGYAQATGRPAAVIIHVDVGTQALAGAIHNVDRARVPVLIYAGASPFSSLRELKGSRNEWIMWMQDVPDQSSIVRQYMRHTAQINSGRTVTQVVNRALQIAMSEPKGPVYLWARREVMEEELPDSFYLSLPITPRPPLAVSPSGLSAIDVTALSNAFISAINPLIITGHLGRNQDAVASLVTLSTLLALPIYCACPSTVNVPFSHPYLYGITYLTPTPDTERYKAHLENADVILVIDCDIPWLPLRFAPKADARIFILDGGDPFKTTVTMGMWDFSLHPGVEMVCRADAELALGQVLDSVKSSLGSMSAEVMREVSETVKGRQFSASLQHKEWIQALDEAEVVGSPATGQTQITVPQAMAAVREVTESYTPSETTGVRSLSTLVLNEAISNYPFVWEHIRPEKSGSFFTSGGSSLGWSLAAAIGSTLGIRTSEDGSPGSGGYDLTVNVVGDGSYLFGVPTSAFWIARRYETPFLTIVLNNGGWKSPKLSMLGVHPSGHGSRSFSGEQLSVGFRFDQDNDTAVIRECPDYSQVAVAATGGWAWGKRVGVHKEAGLESALQELKATLKEAVRIVVEEKRCAVVDIVLDAL
ncbi:hypothetical protein D9758_017325 [Tetrapyrgos nigripes]|uniref:Uncharacterized protein n=1 Tax=Tetrapyrgos nigripes TaxID=182062 RepID=A0A8H5F993_9AGAR|nr:hypothetical protein D9758_017325 [Tetrapyrgos nigripes]